MLVSHTLTVFKYLYCIVFGCTEPWGRTILVEVNYQDVISLNIKSQFSLEEANQLVKVVLKITKKHQEDLSQLMHLLEVEKSHSKKSLLRSECEKVVSRWNQKIEKLGGRPSGIWFADFDFGRGYFCWKYPETKISHWHKYSEGFSKRKLLEKNFDVTLPEAIR